MSDDRERRVGGQLNVYTFIAISNQGQSDHSHIILSTGIGSQSRYALIMNQGHLRDEAVWYSHRNHPVDSTFKSVSGGEVRSQTVSLKEDVQ